MDESEYRNCDINEVLRRAKENARLGIYRLRNQKFRVTRNGKYLGAYDDKTTALLVKAFDQIGVKNGKIK